MKIKGAVVILMCGWATIAIAQGQSQGQSQTPAQGAAPAGPCLIVAPKPIFKYEIRDSYNLPKEDVKDIYNSKDLTELRKEGVHVIIVDPLGKQLPKAQESCQATPPVSPQPAANPNGATPPPAAGPGTTSPTPK